MDLGAPLHTPILRRGPRNSTRPVAGSSSVANGASASTSAGHGSASSACCSSSAHSSAALGLAKATIYLRSPGCSRHR
jgi:hypothetical protein